MSMQFFVMSEVASNLFHENPTVFSKVRLAHLQTLHQPVGASAATSGLQAIHRCRRSAAKCDMWNTPPTQELRTGRYPKVLSHHPDVLNTAAVLALPPELGQTGLTLLTPETVESLLTDRRQAELVQPFRLALLKLASQEAARLMAAGEYELALPVALDAVKQGQALFRPAPALQLFPLYLLAAQVRDRRRRARRAAAAFLLWSRARCWGCERLYAHKEAGEFDDGVCPVYALVTDALGLLGSRRQTWG